MLIESFYNDNYDNYDNDDNNHDITAAAAAAVSEQDEDAVADDAPCRPVYVLVRSSVRSLYDHCRLEYFASEQ